MDKFRVGFGYDVHPLISGRDLMIGGVHVPFNKGAQGHSDADVLLHALTDALLGAAGLGDIGTRFPDTDAAFKNISSRFFIEETMRMINGKGLRVNNVDATVVLQEPKLTPFISEIRSVISSLLAVSSGDIAVKATTTEYLGYIGNGEGIAAFAVVSLVG